MLVDRALASKDLKTTFPNSFVGNFQLLEENCCPPGCGIIAWATALKLIVVEADFKGLKGKEIIVIKRCPEFKGKGSFKTGKVYKVMASNRYDSTYLIANNYDKINSFFYWSVEITLLQ